MTYECDDCKDDDDVKDIIIEVVISTSIQDSNIGDG